jgi:hypothetical protein
MWTGLVWLRYWTFGFHKLLGNYSVQTTRDLSSSAQLHGVSYVTWSTEHYSGKCSRWKVCCFMSLQGGSTIGDVPYKFRVTCSLLEIVKGHSSQMRCKSFEGGMTLCFWIQDEIKRRLNSGNACYHSVPEPSVFPSVVKQRKNLLS